jgi:alpha-L-fucosidase
MKTIFWFGKAIIILILILSFSCGDGADKSNLIKQYDPNWESLSEWTVPQWFEDAVLGIYCHWGVYSVPLDRTI